MMKDYINQKCFCLKIVRFMFFANLIFVVSHLEIYPAVHLNSTKALASLYSKRKNQ